ncbi:hypothetical protein HRbin32_00367 [bacterium HR32]|nr:hypothetical protein HRbin32_00367 [bacterium HR32]
MGDFDHRLRAQLSQHADGGHVARLLEGDPKRDGTPVAAVVVLGPPVTPPGDAVLHGRVQQHPVGGHSVFQRRGVDEGLERRAGLASRLPRAVELGGLEVHPAHHGQHPAGTRLHRHQGSLAHAQAGPPRLLHAPGDHLLGDGLKPGVQGGVHAEAAVVHGVLAVALHEGRQDVRHEVGSPYAHQSCVPDPGQQAQRHSLGSLRPGAADVPEFRHAIQDHRLPSLGPLQVVEGRVPGGRLDDSGQQGCFGKGEIAGALAEEQARRHLHPVSSVAEVHLVQVPLQDLVLCEPPLDLHGQQDLLQLAVQRPAWAQEQVAGQLLGDGTAPLYHRLPG